MNNTTLVLKIYHQILGRVPKGTEGRTNIGNDEDKQGKKVYHSKVHLIDGYDKGGAYWDTTSDIYVEFTLDKKYIKFSSQKKKLKESKYKSAGTFMEIIKTVKFGDSRLGRPNTGNEEQAKAQKKKIHAVELRLNNQNKDIGGIEWAPLGPTEKLFVYYTLDLSYIEFKKVTYGTPPPIFDIIKKFYNKTSGDI